MNRKRNKYLLVALGLLIISFLVKTAMINGDFKCFIEAANILRNGDNPYNNWIFVSEGNYCLYFYSPLWLVFLMPFTFLPEFVPKFLWLTLNAFLLYRTWHLLKEYIESTTLTAKQFSILLLLCVVMSFRFILYNFGMIQMTIFLLWAVLESIRLFREGKFIFGGLLLALVINIKLLPIVIVPYLIYRNYHKGFVSTSIFTLFLLALPGLFIGWSQNSFLLSEWWNAINPANDQHLIETDIGPHSLTALIPTLLTETEGKLDISRNILNLDQSTAIFIMNLVRLSLVVLTLVFLKWPPFTYPKSKLAELRELAFIMAIVPLIFPHQQKYAFFLTAPAIFYLCHFIVLNYSFRKVVITNGKWIFLIILFSISFVLMTLSTDGVVGRELNHLTQHFKFITWGTFALIGALFLANPGITLQSIQLQKEQH